MVVALLAATLNLVSAGDDCLRAVRDACISQAMLRMVSQTQVQESVVENPLEQDLRTKIAQRYPMPNGGPSDSRPYANLKKRIYVDGKSVLLLPYTLDPRNTFPIPNLLESQFPEIAQIKRTATGTLLWDTKSANRIVR